MLIDEIDKQLKEGKTLINTQGPIMPISTSPETEIYGFVKIRSLDGAKISYETIITNNILIGMQASASGATLLSPDGYPEVIRIDNSHTEIGLHEHTEEGVSKIKEETVGDVLSRFFRDFV